MSTIKTDALTSVTTNTDLTLSANGTGGVKVSDYFQLTKGADISSATSLTLGTDGNAFDVTGTTTITSIATQGIGSHITLHFDGALTFTHHSTNLILPGAASITTAAGDIAVMYEYASADWRCVSYTKASGAAVVAGGGAWNLIGTSVASTSASLTVTGLDSTYDTYAIAISDMVPATDNVNMYFRLGDSGGIDSGSTDYSYAGRGHREDGSPSDVDSTGAAQIEFCGSSGNASGEGFGAMMYLHRPGDGTTKPMITWDAIVSDINGLLTHHYGGGMRDTVIAVDRVQVLINTGNIASGRLTVWGLAHA